MANTSQKQVYQLDVGLSREHFEAIGQVAAYWSLLEHHVGMAIADMLDVDIKKGRVLTTHMNIRPKLEILQLLAELNHWSETDKADLKSAIDNIFRAQELRNQLIHGVWGKDDNGKFHILWSRGGKQQRHRILPKAIPAETSDIQQIAFEIAAVAKGFIIWWNARKAAPSASP